MAESVETFETVRRISVEEYHRLGDVGFFSPDEHVELLEGVIWTMSPKYSPHSTGISLIEHTFGPAIAGQAGLRIEQPITLSPYSEPEPDVAIVRKSDPRAYLDHHPTAKDVLLLIEVADTSLKIARKTKGRLYAAAGIADYWILNLKERRLEVYRDPVTLADGTAGYGTAQLLQAGERVTPVAFPDLSIAVEDLLP